MHLYHAIFGGLTNIRASVFAKEITSSELTKEVINLPESIYTFFVHL